MTESCYLPLVLLLLLSIRGTCGSRIIGGEEVEPHSIRYQASLQYQNSNHHVCGGTLISPQWVVSAAHCWNPTWRMKVVLSEHRLKEKDGHEQVFNVSRAMVYYTYSSRTFDSDIMLIKLSRPATLNEYVQPVNLPGINTPPLRHGTACTVSGWGVTRIYSSHLSPVLRSVDVNIITQCQYYYWFRTTKNMICAGTRLGGKDSCQGDSGGPLVCNGTFEGIVSWGISCANPYYPGVYTKVRNYLVWIKWIMQKF